LPVKAGQNPVLSYVYYMLLLTLNEWEQILNWEQGLSFIEPNAIDLALAPRGKETVMNKRARVYAALEGQMVDLVPLSLWRHFHKQNQTPTGLASATLAFYRQYDLDLIKLTPNDFYAVEDWGASLILSKDDDTPSRLKHPVISKPEGWRHLTTLNPREGSYGATLESIKLVTSQLGQADAPLLMTIFSPLTLAFQLAGEQLLEHLQSHATDVHIGLATIAETTSRFAHAALEAGADGIFFASHLSQTDKLSREMCETFVVRYDLIALERVKAQPVPLVLYLHGANPYFDTVNDYPVHAVSWQNADRGPSLAEALLQTDKTLLTGLDDSILEAGQPEAIASKVSETVRLTGGKRLILAPTDTISAKVSGETLALVAHLDRSVDHSAA
jgi:uroporphyrinogen decarboxylase